MVTLNQRKVGIPIKWHDLTGYSFREYRTYDESTNKPVSRAIVLFIDKDALLYDIEVDRKYRKTGHGTALITAIQNQFETIVTSWYSEEGKRLCLKNKFVVADVKEKHKVPKLVWCKGGI